MKAIQELSGANSDFGHLREWQDRPMALLERGYREAGPVFSFRLGPQQFVVLAEPEANFLFFKETDHKLSLRDAMQFLTRAFSPDFYSFAERGRYNEHREIIFPQLKPGAIGAYLTIMQEEAEHVVGGLGEGKVFSPTALLGPVTLNIAARSFIGDDFGRRLGRDVFGVFNDFGRLFRSPAQSPDPQGDEQVGLAAKEELSRIIREGIALRRAGPLDTPDFLQKLAEATYRDGSPVEDHIIVNIVLFLLFAGHETTTGAVSWALLTFARNPDFLDRVRAECDDVLGTDPAQPPTRDQLASLKLLDNGISEVLRLYPPAFALTRVAAESFAYKDYTIPQGAVVIASPVVTHAIESLWHDAGSFIPERWNNETPRDLRDRFLTFGGGIHSCLGVHFARLEMKLLLLGLIRHFDLEVPGEIRPRGGPAVNWPDADCKVACTRRRAGLGTGA